MIRTSTGHGRTRYIAMAFIAAWSLPLLASGTGLELTGPAGSARPEKGPPIEGLMVQLIAQSSGIRTTVFTDPLGRFSFPRLVPGTYTLRVPRPLEFLPYVREDIQIRGADRLAEILLTRRNDSEFLPPLPEVISQLTDAELLYNLPGSGYEKKIFSNNCGNGCHTYQWAFRARFDQRSWRLIVDRMLNFTGRLLIARRAPGTEISSATINTIADWLARVRGIDATDAPLKAFARPQGPAAHVVITEYQVPHLDARIHDVTGDAEGNIWYTSNRNPILGKLNPRTGQVTEYPVPRTAGKPSGQHWIEQAKDGAIWYSETWTGNLVRFDPKSGVFRTMHTGLQGNMALAPDGFLWRTWQGAIHKFDPQTGKSVAQYPLKKTCSTYGNFISADGRYFFGGGGYDPVCTSFDGIVFLDIKTGEVIEADSPSGVSFASRGSFDPAGNVWAGGRGGVLVKFDRSTHLVSEYPPPTPYTTFYETRADKNGEVWAGEMRAGRIARFTPQTYRWIEYMLPEPYAFDWQTWIDNSTTPVTVWYGDHYGYIVRLQPRD
ncbi:MAG TPA: carboxypeptidase regulatory-like domain-containing protein [Steroidobacteraceae bacterium]